MFRNSCRKFFAEAPVHVTHRNTSKYGPVKRQALGTAALDSAIRLAFQDESLKEEQHQCKGIATKARASAAWTELTSNPTGFTDPKSPTSKGRSSSTGPKSQT